MDLSFSTRVRVGAVIGAMLAALLSGCVTRTPENAVAYRLAAPGQVTIAIDDASGRRVRNLIAAAERPAGRHLEIWDGLDDVGRPVPLGEYHWRGLVHGPITSHFLDAFYSPGEPPWLTYERPAQWYIRPGGSGGWLTDHERPLCAYAAGDRIFLGAALAEAGHSIIEVDPDGRKRWGTLWLSLSGAQAIALDNGVLFVAGEKGWMGDWLAVNRLDAKSYQWIGNPPELRKLRTDACFIKEKSADYSGIRGMVVTPKFIVLSLADRGRLALFDRDTAAHVRDVPLPGAGGLVRTASGEILAVSGTQIVQVDLTAGQHRVVVSSELVEPWAVAVDSKGLIYVTDGAPAVQRVRVFTPSGRFLRFIGNPGGRREGRYDPEVMSHPAGIAIDSRDQVWVAEHDYLPKRVSVWGANGKLVREYLGPPHYGGGGALDPQNPQRAFYKGMVFERRPWPEPAKLTQVLYRPEAHPDLPYPPGDESVPQEPVYRDGKLYLVHDTGWGLPGVFIGAVMGERLVPRVMFGSLGVLCKAWAESHPAFVAKFTAGGKPPAGGVFLWCDNNGDGQATPDEVSIRPDWQFGSMWAQRAWPTLTLNALAGDAVMVLEPVPESGGLRYDLAQARRVPLPEIVRKKGIGALAVDPQGNLIINCGGGGNQGDRDNVLAGVAPDGRLCWTYPNPFPANWHDSPRPLRGEIQHTLNVEGFAAVSPAAGTVFQLNSNKGLRHLFTTDGLYVSPLFGDMRLAPLQQTVLQATTGMRLDGVSLGDECFFGWFGRGADGRFYQVVGKDSSNVCEVRGLESLRRLSGGPVVLTAQATLAQPAAAAAGANGPVEVKLGNWSEAWMKLRSYPIPAERPVARFAVAATPDDLQIVVDVDDDSPFVNNGQDPQTLFHTGDAIDLRLATNRDLPAARTTPGVGDLRLVVAMLNGKPVVVRYRFVVPGTATPATIASPTGKVTVDAITVLSMARVDVTREAKRCRVSIWLPWAELGLAGLPQGELRGDVGVILSDTTGSRAVARHYHFDRGSQVVSDLPSETRVDPSRWGVITF